MTATSTIPISLPICPRCGEEKEGSYLRAGDDLICKMCREGEVRLETPPRRVAPQLDVSSSRRTVVGRPLRSLANAVGFGHMSGRPANPTRIT